MKHFAARLFCGVLLVGIVLTTTLIAGWAGHTEAALPVRTNASARTTSVRIYLIAVGNNGQMGRKLGCGDSLVAITRAIAPTTAPLTAAIKLLLSDHRQYYGRSGLYNALYRSRLKVVRARVAGGTAVIDLVGTMRLGGECDNPRVGAELRQTALQFPTVHQTSISINGVPLWKLLSLR